jgi:transcriptional regulator with XRE-family HTH domain
MAFSGEKLKQLRERADLTAEELARALFDLSAGACRISKSAIYSYERGRAVPPQDTIPLLARALKCEDKDLMEPDRAAARASRGGTLLGGPPSRAVSKVELTVELVVRDSRTPLPLRSRRWGLTVTLDPESAGKNLTVLLQADPNTDRSALKLLHGDAGELPGGADPLLPLVASYREDVERLLPKKDEPRQDVSTALVLQVQELLLMRELRQWVDDLKAGQTGSSSRGKSGE